MNSTIQNLFGNINDPGMQKVLRALAMIEDVSVKAGDFIFHDGDKSSDFYIIGLGAVEVVKVLDKEIGKEKVLDTLGSGDFFGEGSLFSNEPRGAGVRALSDSRLFKIDKSRFFELLKNNNDIAITFLSNMLAVVNERLRHANKELLVLYEVSRLVADGVKGIDSVAKGVLEQLVSITSNEKALFVLLNENLNTERVIAEYGFDGEFPDFPKEIDGYDSIKAELKGLNTHYKIHSKYLFLGIKDLKGKLNGMIVMWDKDEDFNHDEIRLCLSVAEQLGHVIENFAGEESEKGRNKLGREFLSF
ncbi:MAG: cyclic nucleotide-binding domain-containing protein [Candidatus Peregrinibacteria bacterium]|nr:cyclic nucleotide-binding domain-containing protein [Candidatus Peregrinibacteria bacterium]MDZ4245058.1 cyclic nucleotide-binding domain-containing protein [Candidatus Gracilibacteria bacterium]